MTLDNVRMPKTDPMPRWKGHAQLGADGGLDTASDDTCTLQAMNDLGFATLRSKQCLT